MRNRAAYGLEYHASSYGILPGKSVLTDGGKIPYTPAALKKRNDNFEKRAELDPFNKCFMPGVPRIMYIEHPFQIFQTPNHVAMTFEWSQVYRLFYTDGSKHQDGIEFWMGDNRARWEGDTLVNEATNFNDQTWLDAAGNFHSEQLKVTERYTMIDPDTIQYEVRLEDPKVFARPWSITMPFFRHKDMDRLLAHYFGTDEPRITQWMNPGRYVTGPEIAEAGLAEMLDLAALAQRPAAAINQGRKKKG